VVLWQSDLRISWRSQWFSLLLHGVVAAIVLLMPWPLSYTPLWLLLLSLVVFDSVRSQRRIHACRGNKADDRFAFALAKSGMGDCRHAVGD
jgi:toxin CptA